MLAQPIKSFNRDLLQVKVYGDVTEMGEAAADFVNENIQIVLQQKGFVNLILATGSSQFSFLDALKMRPIDWSRITVFHLDEYLGISDQHPASFRRYLKERILDSVKPAKIYFLNGDAPNPDEETYRYEILLKAKPTDIACIGIGENGHIAFNDPPVADFNDSRLVKIVDLDHACRMQQLGEGWFPRLEDVPTRALSLTIPAILKSKVISCVVPDSRKAAAVYNTLNEEITTKCPASILRKHQNTVLFLDSASSGLIDL